MIDRSYGNYRTDGRDGWRCETVASWFEKSYGSYGNYRTDGADGWRCETGVLGLHGRYFLTRDAESAEVLQTIRGLL